MFIIALSHSIYYINIETKKHKSNFFSKRHKTYDELLKRQDKLIYHKQQKL